MRIVYVIGARPNFVKMAPVISELRRRIPDGRHAIVHTGQHYDRMMSDAFVEELGVPEPDYALGVGSASHAAHTARVMERIEPVLESERPDLVIVPGDVNSTLAASLVASKLGLPLAHLEAGLRSFDRTMPEEINQIVADELSEHLFVHCDEAIENLRAQGIAGERIHFVGNTMIDSLVAMAPRFRELGAVRGHGSAPGEYLLVTLHRPALVDGTLLSEVMAQLAVVAREMPVIFPVHPRTRRMLPADDLGAGLRLVEPLGYLEFLSLEADAGAVLTDSGGVQEETTYLGFPCFTLRDNTERPVTVRAGTNTILGLAPERIGSIPAALRRDGLGRAREPPPGWDGRAAGRVADVIDGGSSLPPQLSPRPLACPGERTGEPGHHREGLRASHRACPRRRPRTGGLGHGAGADRRGPLRRAQCADRVRPHAARIGAGGASAHADGQALPARHQAGAWRTTRPERDDACTVDLRVCSQRILPGGSGARAAALGDQDVGRNSLPRLRGALLGLPLRCAHALLLLSQNGTEHDRHCICGTRPARCIRACQRARSARPGARRRRLPAASRATDYV